MAYAIEYDFFIDQKYFTTPLIKRILFPKN